MRPGKKRCSTRKQKENGIRRLSRNTMTNEPWRPFYRQDVIICRVRGMLECTSRDGDTLYSSAEACKCSINKQLDEERRPIQIQERNQKDRKHRRNNITPFSSQQRWEPGPRNNTSLHAAHLWQREQQSLNDVRQPSNARRLQRTGSLREPLVLKWRDAKACKWMQTRSELLKSIPHQKISMSMRERKAYRKITPRPLHLAGNEVRNPNLAELNLIKWSQEVLNTNIILWPLTGHSTHESTMVPSHLAHTQPDQQPPPSEITITAPNFVETNLPQINTD